MSLAIAAALCAFVAWLTDQPGWIVAALAGVAAGHVALHLKLWRAGR